jgi:hypothetical protein
MKTDKNENRKEKIENRKSEKQKAGFETYKENRCGVW